MNQYCKHISEFSLFNEFKPGEFKIVDFFKKHLVKGEEELSRAFLDSLRQFDSKPKNLDFTHTNHIYVPDINMGYAISKSKAILDCDIFGLDYPFHLDTEFVEVDSAEFIQILKVLKERNFILTNSRISFLFSNFRAITVLGRKELYSEDYLSRFIDNRWDFYEKVIQITDGKLEKIFEFFQILSPSQYEILRHFILTIDRRYFYTNLERETLDVALYNASQLWGLDNNVLYS